MTVALDEGRVLAAQIWIAQVGRVPLLLLDSYVEENEPALREVTDRLYGGGSDHRLCQELLLGIGGVRAVRAFCALTGHPSPRCSIPTRATPASSAWSGSASTPSQGVGFDEAIELCRAGTVFTTHTPVPAGIDRFARELVERHFSGMAADPALPCDRVLALGAETYPGGDPAVFNMAVMGMRLAQRVNGVSKLHGQVSREMFAGLWPGFDTCEVPIGSVTNGVHAPSWVAGRSSTWPRRRSEPGPVGLPRTGTPGSAWRTRRRCGCGRSAGRCGPAGHAGPAAGARLLAAARRPVTRNSSGPTRCSTRTC